MLNRDNQGTSNWSQQSTVAANQTSPGSRGQQSGESGDGSQETAAKQLPSISIPKGGGAIRGMGEKFAANPVTGTGSMTVPIATSPGRSGFGPQLSLSYDSGAGNGPFGFGWNLSLPSITRKTDKGLPKYQDAEESDVFILSGAEDLVPVLRSDGSRFEDDTIAPGYTIHRYRPRIEGLFARIERWTDTATGESHWRSISKDNITTFYGKDNNSRIFDPADPDPAHPTQIFSWLICQSYDDKGNAIVYEYAEENDHNVDRSQVNERNRMRTANRYLKRIKYGNRAPNRDVTTWLASDPTQLPNDTWMFEVVFDYDEGHYAEDDPDAQGRVFVRSQIDPPAGSHWPVRQDPFSSYRAGFEVRTYRLCRRVLMFHHFPRELRTDDYLVRSTEFTYSESPIASFITKVTQSGYVRQPDLSYQKKSLPPLEFEYSQATIHEEIQEVDAESLENLPYGLDGARYQWVDLDGEGLSGILTEQGDGWFYKRNLSPINIRRENGREMATASFGAVELIAEKPSLAALNGGGQQFLDLAGDGQLDLVGLQGPTPGFYERTHDERWESFAPFDSLPVLEWGNPNLKFVDLTGDGHADIFISEDEAFCWHPSLAEAGFGPAESVRQALDEEKGPRLVFADGTQSIYLADLSGDGLTDLVRIRNGEVCYWPNLGYGRFGMKVTMDNAPWFDAPDLFDQRRIRLADIDGSGVTDIIYLGSDGVQIYFNQSGNSWKDVQTLARFPRIDNLSAVMAVDLLGNGTACLVWSSSLPGDARRPMRYIDLMGGQKPHLLLRTINNLGAETEVNYSPSTKFYVRDKLDGKPWITKIPFPVHVVERVITNDHISRNRFVTRYAYHHGYFDGVEREFRGFGMVEQFDTEEFAVLNADEMLSEATNIDAASHVPPVLTKTWFHTGIYLGRDHVSNFFAGLLDMHDRGEYYREPAWRDNDVEARIRLLDDTVLPAGLTVEEEREACRALKGAMLRQEIYAIDGTGTEDYPHGHPYTVTEQNFTIEHLQPQAGNRHAIFFTHAREALSYHYERNPDDPRMAHAMTLEVDKFGNVLKAAAVGYGRRQSDPDLEPEDQAKQTQILITCTENSYTNEIDLADAYRTPLPCESRTFELTGLELESSNRFAFEAMSNAVNTAAAIEYHETPDGSRQKRLIEHVRSLYRRDDLTGPLSLQQLQPLALPYESYKLAFTPELISQVYDGRVTDTMLADEGKYLHSEGDDNWWIPSGRVFFSPNDEAPNDELAFAQAHFFLPHRVLDPFGEAAVVQYDNYKLLVTQTIDPLNNTIIAENDYRVLQPWRATDPNGNRAQVAFDTLGMVAGTAVMGKADEDQGDVLDGFNADLTPDQIDDFFNASDPHNFALDLLGNSTGRIIYDLDRFRETRADNPNDPTAWQPVFAATLARETHFHDPDQPEELKIQISFGYSDGFGREIQKKIQAEPGPLVEDGPTVDPRWVGSGWTIFNNKGKPVRQYEPFFSSTHEFEFAKIVGVSPVLFYDPVERVVATLHPNDTYEKVIFDPWRQETWEVNDTVLLDPRTDADVRGFTEKYFAVVDDPPGTWQTWYAQRDGGEKGPQEQDAATKAAAHAGTSTVAHFDTLGRPFLTIADNGAAGKYETRVELDIEGNQRSVTDARDLQVMAYDYDMLGTRIHQNSMDAGEKWTLNDVAGKPIRAWDTPPNPDHPGHAFRMEYDALRRPVRSFVQGAIANEPSREILFERVVYGENQTDDDVGHNLRGKVYQMYDAAGMVTSDDYDFKGNLLRSSRQLVQEYRETIDWNVTSTPDGEIFTTITEYDALNRPTRIFTPHNGNIPASIVRPTYNEANLLNQVEVNLRNEQENGEPKWTPFVTYIDYNAKGQREVIEYGNGVQTEYDYDPLTFRLTHLKTTRDSEGDLQNLSYTYDPIGNITHIRDDAQQIIYFDNTVVEPSNDYLYDAIYRLIEATGREHLGQTNGVPNSPHRIDHDDSFFKSAHHPGDGNAMGRYRQGYEYDEVGNILAMRHRGTDPANPGWKRCYQYALDSNRLLSTGDPSDPHNPDSSCPTHYAASPVYAEHYSYDAHGNMTRMPHLANHPDPEAPNMHWDFKDQLHQVDLGGGGTAYYVYDAAGQRVRKVHEHNGGLVEERIYLGGFEIYRKNGVNPIVRETLHIMDDKQRIALVDTRTEGEEEDVPEQLIRYQFGNHLGSATLELNEFGAVISYEEYHPYGTTSYQAGRSVAEVSLKRYRYTGMERDEETGLNYHTARYYAPWLGRWTACDPIGIADDMNLYRYVGDNPLTLIDPTGTYHESVHYYTTFFIAMAAGYSFEDARKIALYANLPDEWTPLDAQTYSEREISLGLLDSTNNLPGAYGRRVVSEGIHAFDSGESGRHTAQQEQEVRQEIVAIRAEELERSLSTNYGRGDETAYARLGYAVHALGDAYSHTTLENESQRYGDIGGHGVPPIAKGLAAAAVIGGILGNIIGGIIGGILGGIIGAIIVAILGFFIIPDEISAPDNPATRPRAYGHYVDGLLNAFLKATGRESILSESELNNFIREVSSVEDEHAQIQIIRNAFQRHFGVVIPKDYRPEETGPGPKLSNIPGVTRDPNIAIGAAYSNYELYQERIRRLGR